MADACPTCGYKPEYIGRGLGYSDHNAHLQADLVETAKAAGRLAAQVALVEADNARLTAERDANIAEVERLVERNVQAEAERDRYRSMLARLVGELDTMQANMPFGGNLAGAHEDAQRLLAHTDQPACLASPTCSGPAHGHTDPEPRGQGAWHPPTDPEREANTISTRTPTHYGPCDGCGQLFSVAHHTVVAQRVRSCCPECTHYGADPEREA